jgi:hypothetical protein
MLTSLLLRSVATSAFTRVFDALWRRVSKDGGKLGVCGHGSRRRVIARLLTMRV